MKRIPPTLDEVRPLLWNDSVRPSSYSGDGAKYLDAILEQYKLYVEMADRVSSRRGLANTFFLTLNTLLFTLLGVFWKDRPEHIPTFVLALLLVATVGECCAWWMIVRSYRQLNSGKYKIVGLLEERLPASPYWSAEWKVLGEGENVWLYLPLSHVEQWVPILFASIYTIGFILAVAA
jgi:hypothetical protein